MPPHMVLELLRNIFTDPHTNEFPARHTPKSISAYIAAVEAGEVEMIPPVEIPPEFRGKISNDWEVCIGCRQCIKTCPPQAISFDAEQKRVHIHVARCIFCAQCVDTCPVNAMSMSDEFALGTTDKTDESLLVGPPKDWRPPPKPKKKAAAKPTSKPETKPDEKTAD